MFVKDVTAGEHKLSSKIDSMINVTYSQLVDMRDNGELIPGQQYRITDYVTTTVQENTISAGHVFDIIVTVDSENILNEEARAIQNDNDTKTPRVRLNTGCVWFWGPHKSQDLRGVILTKIF